MAQCCLQRVIARSSGELIDPYCVESRIRPVSSYYATVKTRPIYWNREIYSICPATGRARQESSERNGVYVSLLRQVPALGTNICDGGDVVSGESLFNGQAHIGNAREVVRIDIP